MGYVVYFIQEESPKGTRVNMPMKIGHTNDIEVRLRKLQTGNPRRLLVRAAIQCESKKEAKSLEFTIQNLAEKKFKRLYGEWFTIHGSMMKLVEDANKRLKGNPKV